MTDYIKREDAIRTMAQYMMDMALIDNPEASDHIEQWEGSIAAPVMSTIKAADVIEIVRCKDCKHYKRNIPCVGGHYNGCDEWIDEGNAITVYDNDYCSYGERVDE